MHSKVILKTYGSTKLAGLLSTEMSLRGERGEQASGCLDASAWVDRLTRC